MTQDQTLPSLAVLRCFEAAAKYQSFTDAAAELGLTQGVVSRHVRDLEDWIGVALFRRQGRGVCLTDAGAALAQELSGDLGRLRQTLLQASISGAHRQLLRLAAPPTFSARWLVPRLPAFRTQHPSLEFVLISRSGPFDLAEARIDVAIHFGGPDWPGARLTPLCPEQLVAVAAPELCGDDTAHTLRSLRDLPLLHMTGRPELWDMFFRTHGLEDPDHRRGSYFDQFGLVIAAALAGMGAAILPTYLIETEIREGRLRALAALPGDPARQYFIAMSPGPRTALTQQLIGWMRGQVRRPAGPDTDG